MTPLAKLSRQAHLLFRMTICDFKLRDQGTALGFLWTLFNPLLMFGVLYLVFASWFGRLIDNYPVYLALGIIHWNFFSLATSNSVTIFERKRHLLKSFPVSRSLIPLSAVLTVFISYILESALVLFMCSFLVSITLSGLIWFAALLILHLFLALGVSLFLSNAFIFFRDISHLWAIALRIGFFLTPVFYPLSVVSDAKLVVLKLNPLYHLFTASRSAILTGTVEIDGYFLYLIIFSIS